MFKTLYSSYRQLATVCILAALTSGCTTPLLSPSRGLPDNCVRPVVAVTSFDNRSSFAGQWKLGSGMADLLVSELLECESFVVVERAHLRNVVGEIDLQDNKRFRAEGKVDKGRLKNAQYLIRGVINDFSQVGGGSFALTIRSILFGGRGYNARVAMTLTIVDVESGEIIDSMQASGTARAREAYIKGKYKDVHFGGDAFFRTPLGIATANAIRRGVGGIVKKMPREYWRPMIADMIDGTVLLNGGKDRGYKVDAVYVIRGEGRTVTDPVTGDVLETIAGPIIGTLKVTTVKDRIAYAAPIRGKGFERGQYLVTE